MLIAPSEPRPLRDIGQTSSVPEKFGVDILFGSRLGSVGVQRKELSDFFASVTDGRLAREYPMMNPLTVSVLLLEGKQRWSDEGLVLNSKSQPWTRDQWESYMMSVRSKGLWVVYTDSLTDTIAWVQNFERWANKEKHGSLDTRPKPTGAWGKPESRDWNVFLAQSFPGIGVVQANRIVDHFGCVPIHWSVTVDELQRVPGIGKKRAEDMIEALNRERGTSDG